ncbi:MAG: polynucleotide adenylyltransferase PcnB [Myxococcales bacterium]|nr:polynucleotide adenylyltransferase PcnB [Myxococcales bacterium]MCB9700446.1 polynucleotide adenylyltransferase PcnB [Myxococcales bacterium]
MAQSTQEGPYVALPLSEVDPDALKVVRKLLANGHEAYLVGGCVRDLYLRRRPKDFDVATSATPESIRKTFRNSRIIGRRFKLAHVYFGTKVIETSTFRTTPITTNDDDLLITHDNEWGNIEDDARRRDFTINGLFYDIESDTIVDLVAGIPDLDRGVIRTIGDPLTRFQEDPVRMIRAVKFAARLDFTIEEETWRALLATVGDIDKCSRARLLEEVYKLLRGGAARRSFELLLESGLFPHVLPSFVELFDSRSGLGLVRPQRIPDEHEDLPRGYQPSRLLWALLDALDEYTLETRQIASNGVLLAILLAPIIDEDWLSAPRRDLDKTIDATMDALCNPLGVARRDRELARQILMAHRRMVETPGARRKRRPSLVQRQYFHDALVFLGIAVQARGEGGSEFAHWQRLAASATPMVEREGAGDDEDDGKRRRRRRGNRSRRGRQAGGDRAARSAGQR